MKNYKSYNVNILILLGALLFLLQGCDPTPPTPSDDYLAQPSKQTNEPIVEGENTEEGESKTQDTQQLEININGTDYRINKQPIGSGTYGMVYKGYKKEEQNKVDKTFYAIKCLNNLDDKEDEVLKEIMDITKSRGADGHPNIVKYYGCEILNGTKWLAMEWVEGVCILGSATGAIPGGAKQFNQTMQFLEEITALNGFPRKHDSETWGNILVKDNQIKLIDFGTLTKNLFERKIIAQDQIIDESTDEDGNTALHRAIMKKEKSIPQSLIKNYSKSKNKQGETPLHIAVALNNSDIIGAMWGYRDYRPDLQAKNNQGSTPLDVALDRDMDDIIICLIKFLVKTKEWEEAEDKKENENKKSSILERIKNPTIKRRAQSFLPLKD